MSRRQQRPARRLNKTERAILEVLAEDPTLSQVKIAKRIGCARQTVGDYIRGSLADDVRRMTRAVVEDSVRRARAAAPNALLVMQALMAGKDPNTGLVPTMTMVSKGQKIEIEAPIFPSTRLKAASKLWEIAQSRIEGESAGDLPDDAEPDPDQLERIARAYLKEHETVPPSADSSASNEAEKQEEQVIQTPAER
jgi:DNA-binding Lrp family transcriptional regulator